MRLVFILTALLVLVGLVICNDDQDQDHQDRNDESQDDYHLYDLLDKANRLTGTPSLYSLFSLPDDAPLDQVSRQFRHLSKSMHPDKNPDKADHHAVLTAAHHALKDDKMRRRLRWLLDEAPPWHRATVYTVRKMIRRQHQNPTLSVVVYWLVLASVVVQLVTMWVVWLINITVVWWNKREVGRLGRKEMKRMERKLAEHGPSRAMANSPVQQLIAAREEYPRVPSVLSLWPIAIVTGTVSLLIGKLKRD